MEKSATIGGNLTVSGTGNSTFAGNLQVSGLIGHNSVAGDLDIYSGNGTGTEYAVNLYSRNSSNDAWIKALVAKGTSTTIAGNLTVSGGTVTSGSGTLTLNSSANTIVLQSAGTTALTLDSSQNATFAKTLTAGTTGSLHTLIGPYTATLKIQRDANSNDYVTIGAGAGYTTFNSRMAAANPGFLFNSTNGSTTTTFLTLADTTGDATFVGSIKTVAPTGGTAKPWELGEAATVSPTSPNRTIRVEIDGTVYYLHAKTTND